MTINVRIRDGMCPDPTTGDGGATEGDIRGSFSDIIGVVGVKDLAGGHCAVTQNSPAALSVLVAPGIVYIPNADYNELDSNEPKFYEAIIDAEAEVAIGENTSGSTRIDLICVKIDKTITPDKHASNIATLVAVAGTPGAGAPTLPDNYAKLAEVEVANGASTIVNADITNTRVQSKIDFDFLPKATGAEINTGTEDAKIVTPKAIADSYLANGYSSIHRQAIINGNFDVWQRGTSLTLTPTTFQFLADRWQDYHGADGGTLPTLTRTREVEADNDGSFFYSKLAFDGAGTSLGNNSVGQYLQRIENGTRYLCGNGKKITVSFWAKSDVANKRIGIRAIQNYGTGGSPSADEIINGTNWTLTSTWTQYTYTFTTNTLSGKTFGTNNDDRFEIFLTYMWGSTRQAQYGASTAETYVGSGYVGIKKVQLCAGDVALPFMPKSYEEELRACKRYCHVEKNDGADTAQIIASGVASSATAATFIYQLPATMRVSPSLTISSAAHFKSTNMVDANPDLTGLSIVTASSNERIIRLAATVASGLTAKVPNFLEMNSADGKLTFEAEL